MSRSFQIATLVCLILASVCITGCKKEDRVEPDIEIKDNWEILESDGMSLVLSDSYVIHLTQSNELFAIQRRGGSSYTDCHCRTADGSWKRFAIDSLNSNIRHTFIVREGIGGSFWVVTDTRLSHITSCGTFTSYEIASSDTLSFSDFGNKFVGLEFVNGEPWLLHAKWGLYKYDLDNEVLIHYPNGFSHIPNSANLIGSYNSMAKEPDGELTLASHDGYVFNYNTVNGSWGFLIEYWIAGCADCEHPLSFRDLRTKPQGGVIAKATGINGNSAILNLSQSSGIIEPTLPLHQAPGYYTHSEFDRSSYGYLAFYSGYPNYQPYIGLQPNGTFEQFVNARDAVEEGNVTVYHIAFNQSNSLYAATDKGIIKYLGRDE